MIYYNSCVQYEPVRMKKNELKKVTDDEGINSYKYTFGEMSYGSEPIPEGDGTYSHGVMYNCGKHDSDKLILFINSENSINGGRLHIRKKGGGYEEYTIEKNAQYVFVLDSLYYEVNGYIRIHGEHIAVEAFELP